MYSHSTATASVLALALLTFGNANAAHLRVPSSAYPTIQSAVDAAVAGDRIRVRAGHYLEDVKILQKTDIDLAGERGVVVRSLEIASSSQVEVRRMEFDGSSGYWFFGGQVAVVGSKGITIRRCLFADDFAGMSLLQSEGVTVSRCRFEGMSYGIGGGDCSSVLISKSRFSGGGSGMWMTGGLAGLIVDRCTFEGPDAFPVLIEKSSGVTVRGNRFRSTELILLGCIDAVLEKNESKGSLNSAFLLHNCSSPRVESNRVDGAFAMGLLVWAAGGPATILDNVVTDCGGDGIAFSSDVSGNRVEDNAAVGNAGVDMADLSPQGFVTFRRNRFGTESWTPPGS